MLKHVKRAGRINRSSGKYAASSKANGVVLRFIVYLLTLCKYTILRNKKCSIYNKTNLTLRKLPVWIEYLKLPVAH